MGSKFNGRLFITDHAKERIEQRVPFDVDSEYKKLCRKVMDIGQRMMVSYPNSHDMFKWARGQQKEHGGSEYWEIGDDLVFVFGRDYETFLEKHYGLTLITVLYHPKQDNKEEQYLSEKPFKKRLKLRTLNTLYGLKRSIPVIETPIENLYIITGIKLLLCKLIKFIESIDVRES